MKTTKDTYKNTKAALLKYFCAVLFLICCICIPSVTDANAALLTVHDYVNNDTYNYSRAAISYCINGESVTTEYPGLILSNGAAVGPFHTLFEDCLGISTDYSDGNKTFTISNGKTSIKMTLGNTEAIVNGKTQVMNNAPFIYSFDKSTEKFLYVPTRFVAETFGYDYHWDSTTSTVSIQRPHTIYDGKTKLNYTGTHPICFINGKELVSSQFPGYFFDEIAYFSAEEIFKNSGLASYYYGEGSGLIVLQANDTMVRLVLDSPVVYINDEPLLMDSVPRLITTPNAKKATIYIPAELVAKALGYTVSFQKETLYISGSLKEDSTIPVPQEPVLSGDIVPDTATYGELLFSFDTHEQVISYHETKGIPIPTAFKAYTCLNSDALYLKGINESDMRITDKADVIEITISGYFNPFEGKVSFLPNASYLNYCYFTGSNTIKIVIIKSKDLHYYTYSAPDGCVIHFTEMQGLYQDYLKFSNSVSDQVSSDTDQELNTDTTDIFSGTDMSQYFPDAVFSRNHFIIRLPEGITQRSVTDYDDYHNKRFTISFPGNHLSFLTEQDTYNPVKTLKNVQFNYKAADNTTIITFQTTKIQGYSITIAGGFLAVQIDDPSELYDKIVVLDAGHGGIDPGTLRGKVYEKNVNYNVINVYAPEYFKDSDIKVYFTRTTDKKIALQARADFAASVQADFFISFHVNAHSNSAVNGTSVYYSASNNKATATGLKSSYIATTLVKELSSAWNTKNRGILSEKFVVIHNNTVPAVLIECGFITNDSDFEKIKDTAYQKKAAKAIFDAVSEIFDKYPTKR